MIFRQATLGDLPEIMPMFDDAVTRMLREGKQQWNESYPALPHIMDDIKSAAIRILRTPAPRPWSRGSVIPA